MPAEEAPLLVVGVPEVVVVRAGALGPLLVLAAAGTEPLAEPFKHARTSL